MSTSVHAIPGPILGGLGIAGLGALCGLEGDLFGVVHNAVLLPTLVLGTAAVMLPALYIAGGLAGVMPAAPELGRAAGDAAGRLGLAVLGLCAPASFVLATTAHPAVVRVVVAVALGLGALCALRSLWSRVVPEQCDSVAPSLIFVVWSMLGAGIGSKLVFAHLAA